MSGGTHRLRSTLSVITCQIWDLPPWQDAVELGVLHYDKMKQGAGTFAQVLGPALVGWSALLVPQLHGKFLMAPLTLPGVRSCP